MKKIAKDLKKGDSFTIGSDVLEVQSIELSDVGKQGVQKCRIVAKNKAGESTILIRPSDYPFQAK